MEQESFIVSNELFEQFRQGQEQAFDGLFRKFYAALSHYAFRLTDDEHAADDIAQEAFLSLWQKRQNIRHPDALRSYLYRAVHNLSVSFFRKSDKEAKRRASITAKYPIAEDPVVEAIISAEIVRELQAQVDQLPERMAEVIRLFYFEEKGLDEIGLQLGIDPETARSHRYRGLQLLRKKFPSK